MLDLDAGKYAAYVWPAFAITALVFVAMIASSLGYSGRWRKKAQERGARQ
jgi:heme exporter protein D